MSWVTLAWMCVWTYTVTVCLGAAWLSVAAASTDLIRLYVFLSCIDRRWLKTSAFPENAAGGSCYALLLKRTAS